VIITLGGALAAAFWYLPGKSFPMLQPGGPIAGHERTLLLVSALLMLFVVIPVFAMTFVIAWRYRASNPKARYTPEWDHNHAAEAVWWAIPIVLIGIISVMTWISSHQLDPYKPIVSDAKPVHIQVVALDWKWLFIYPDQGIATVNYIQIPQNVPVAFDVTADAPMNAFWIPQLGSQIYAMPGMSTQLHLVADKLGTYAGSSVNISGEGFAGMKFQVKATSQADFDAWVAKTKKSPTHLDAFQYDKLVQPSQYNPPAFYSHPTAGLYDEVVMKYMMPGMEIR
jgi:cytochrome o ubiquinol oxidase subunit 2